MPFLWRQTSPLRDGSVRWMARCDSLAIPNVNSGRIFCYFRFQPHRPGGYLGDVLISVSPPVGPNAGGHAIVAQWQRMTFPRSRLGVRVPSIALLIVVVAIVIMIYCFPLSSVTAWRACRESQGVVAARMGSTPTPCSSQEDGAEARCLDNQRLEV